MKMSNQEKELREVFKAGMVARDAGAEFDEADDWFDAFLEDEADRAVHEFGRRGGSSTSGAEHLVALGIRSDEDE